jgi:hypothetical protein
VALNLLLVALVGVSAVDLPEKIESVLPKPDEMI